MKPLLVLLVSLLVGPANGHADDHLALSGAGAASCAKFAEMYRSNPGAAELLYFPWAQGFMSGWNAVRLKAGMEALDLGSIPIRDQQAYIRQYCDQHPLGDYYNAVLALLLRFKPYPAP